MCLKVSQCWNLCSLTHTHQGERSTLRTSSFWASPYGFSSSVGSAWSSEKCLAALLHDFLCAHQFDPNGWTAGISPSWRQLLAGVHFSGRHSAAILLNSALLFSFLSLLPNEKNIEVQPEGLYYLWLIHFTVKSTLLYFQKFQRRHDKWSSGHSLMWLFPTENINKWFFLFEKIPKPYQ